MPAGWDNGFICSLPEPAKGGGVTQAWWKGNCPQEGHFGQPEVQQVPLCQAAAFLQELPERRDPPVGSQKSCQTRGQLPGESWLSHMPLACHPMFPANPCHNSEDVREGRTSTLGMLLSFSCLPTAALWGTGTDTARLSLYTHRQTDTHRHTDVSLLPTFPRALSLLKGANGFRTALAGCRAAGGMWAGAEPPGWGVMGWDGMEASRAWVETVPGRAEQEWGQAGHG